jgi:hypothetical protein
MDLISDIQIAATGLRSAFEITKTLLDLKSLAEVQAKVIPLQQTILDAQSAAFSAQTELSNALEEARKAHEELARMKAWLAQRERYKMISPWQGAIVYALRAAAKESDPPHWICSNCYENGRRSILNGAKTKSDDWYKYICPVCKSEVRSEYRGPSSIEYAPD